jgi:hypothetical protein
VAAARFALGRGGSTSRITRWISSKPCRRSSLDGNGSVPDKTSYSITPSE